MKHLSLFQKNTLQGANTPLNNPETQSDNMVFLMVSETIESLSFYRELINNPPSKKGESVQEKMNKEITACLESQLFQEILTSLCLPQEEKTQAQQAIATLVLALAYQGNKTISESLKEVQTLLQYGIQSKEDFEQLNAFLSNTENTGNLNVESVRAFLNSTIRRQRDLAKDQVFESPEKATPKAPQMYFGPHKKLADVDEKERENAKLALGELAQSLKGACNLPESTIVQTLYNYYAFLNAKSSSNKEDCIARSPNLKKVLAALAKLNKVYDTCDCKSILKELAQTESTLGKVTSSLQESERIFDRNQIEKAIDTALDSLGIETSLYTSGEEEPVVCQKDKQIFAAVAKILDGEYKEKRSSKYLSRKRVKLQLVNFAKNLAQELEKKQVEVSPEVFATFIQYLGGVPNAEEASSEYHTFLDHLQLLEPKTREQLIHLKMMFAEKASEKICKKPEYKKSIPVIRRALKKTVTLEHFKHNVAEKREELESTESEETSHILGIAIAMLCARSGLSVEDCIFFLHVKCHHIVTDDTSSEYKSKSQQFEMSYNALMTSENPEERFMSALLKKVEDHGRATAEQQSAQRAKAHQKADKAEYRAIGKKFKEERMAKQEEDQKRIHEATTHAKQESAGVIDEKLVRLIDKLPRKQTEILEALIVIAQLQQEISVSIHGEDVNKLLAHILRRLANRITNHSIAENSVKIEPQDEKAAAEWNEMLSEALDEKKSKGGLFQFLRNIASAL